MFEIKKTINLFLFKDKQHGPFGIHISLADRKLQPQLKHLLSSQQAHGILAGGQVDLDAPAG